MNLIEGGLLHTLVTQNHEGFPPLICLGGNSGSGKTGVARFLIATLGLDPKSLISSGNMFRAMACEKFPEMSPDEALTRFSSEAACDGGVIDRAVDAATAAAFEKPGQQILVAEGRLIPFLAQKHRSRAVIIKVSAEQNRLKRIFSREAALRKGLVDFGLICRETMEREEGYCLRFRQYYGDAAANYLNSSLYTHHLDNDGTPEETEKSILAILGVQK